MLLTITWITIVNTKSMRHCICICSLCDMAKLIWHTRDCGLRKQREPLARTLKKVLSLLIRCKHCLLLPVRLKSKTRRICISSPFSISLVAAGLSLRDAFLNQAEQLARLSTVWAPSMKSVMSAWNRYTENWSRPHVRDINETRK